ncbi:MAG: hypothetical protein K0Q99_1257 [Clostridia bacterium]|jgi:hypothetical protein|nr:hypothetical protein [Clostridia bacterium]
MLAYLTYNIVYNIMSFNKIITIKSDGGTGPMKSGNLRKRGAKSSGGLNFQQLKDR